jgi:uncharacterized protein (DUF1778 family)
LVETARKRSERVALRMTPSTKQTLKRAAAATNKTLTEFLLHAGLEAASDTLTYSARSKALMAALAAPPKTNSKLRALLARKPAGNGDPMSPNALPAWRFPL